nr:alpha/beta hydrolase [Streptomyces sulphureus]
MCAALVLSSVPAVGAPSPPHGCAGAPGVRVPGAAHQRTACLPDLTSAALAGTRYTDTADQAGLTAGGTRGPTDLPGTQLDGYFPDTSHTNTTHGWDHDAQFVIRLPDEWNGGLVVTGAPGNRKQYATDVAIGDTALAAGYAYAATDKGNTGPDFYRDGDRPGDALVEWNRRTTQLARAARVTVARYYAAAPRRTYITGMSNGGYLTRWQLEHHPELYDGGVDWEGALWSGRQNLLTALPTAVAWGRDEAGAREMYRRGFARGSEFLWPTHRDTYWGLTQKIYRAEFDPEYDPHCPGTTAGSTPEETAAPCPTDARYRLDRRPAAVHRALARVELTGRLTRPLLTLHGDLDALLPRATHAAGYARLVARAGASAHHRLYTVQDGNHTDGLHDEHPDRLRPILPCYRSAFTALTAWVEHGTPPPAGHTVPRERDADPVNRCALGS